VRRFSAATLRPSTGCNAAERSIDAPRAPI
jgi:hypothetical protein